MPTSERIMHAGGHDGFEIGGSGAHRIVRMLDAPLEQMRVRGQITEAEYQTLWRFRMHWYLGHQAGDLHAIDLNRVSVQQCDYGAVSSEQALIHRQHFDAGWRSLNPTERGVVSTVALREFGLTAAGAELGYTSPYRGRMAVLELLHEAAVKIMSAWLADHALT